ncbi:hypothetical protein TNCT_736331 [Trichonephila clavata]|uniref:Uncharacterized protein n=1 Tax=Trichonephila clavata TaxID=2740835 RepID=A0A8X6JAU3_TRICU|nr:hypothetical protein TNCT_736331 [Trichonephila clavata]
MKTALLESHPASTFPWSVPVYSCPRLPADDNSLLTPTWLVMEAVASIPLQHPHPIPPSLFSFLLLCANTEFITSAVAEGLAFVDRCVIGISAGRRRFGLHHVFRFSLWEAQFPHFRS